MMFGKVNVCQNSEKHVGNILHPFEHTAIQKSLFIDRYGTVRVLNSILFYWIWTPSHSKSRVVEISKEMKIIEKFESVWFIHYLLTDKRTDV